MSSIPRTIYGHGFPCSRFLFCFSKIALIVVLEVLQFLRFLANFSQVFHDLYAYTNSFNHFKKQDAIRIFFLTSYYRVVELRSLPRRVLFCIYNIFYDIDIMSAMCSASRSICEYPVIVLSYRPLMSFTEVRLEQHCLSNGMISFA